MWNPTRHHKINYLVTVIEGGACADPFIGDRDRRDDRRGARGDRPDVRPDGVRDSGERKYWRTSHAARSRPAGRRRRTRGNGGANRAHSPGAHADKSAAATRRPEHVCPRLASD